MYHDHKRYCRARMKDGRTRQSRITNFSALQIAIGSVPNLSGRRLNSGDDDLDTALVLDELELLVGSQGGGGGDGQEAAREGGDEEGVQGVQVLRARVVADGETHQ